MSDEDDLILWQDALELVCGNRSADAKCPICSHHHLHVTPRRSKIEIKCGGCGRFVLAPLPDG